jgi:hypothetical protein
MTIALAIYASLVATAALALELVSQWRSWSTRVEVQVSRMQLARPNEEPEPVILFRLVNLSGHPVKITHLGMQPLRRGGKHLFFPAPLPLGVPGPFEIPARDSITLYQPPASVADGDPGYRTRAIIATSDNKQFKSKRVRVRDLLEESPAVASTVAVGKQPVAPPGVRRTLRRVAAVKHPFPILDLSGARHLTCVAVAGREHVEQRTELGARPRPRFGPEHHRWAGEPERQCLYCLAPRPGGGEEHILSVALGNWFWALLPGVVCDACNNE